MTPFLDQVADNLISRYGDFSKLVVVLPSNRSIRYLYRAFTAYTDRPLVLPRCISIEDFISELSGLKASNSTETLLRSFTAYQGESEQKKISFQEYAAWGETVMSDFDELDRYLVDTAALFDTIEAIGDLKAWSTDKIASTNLVKNYQAFIRSLKPLYENLSKQLLNDNEAYQGLRYRMAEKRIAGYINSNADLQVVFIGFNALNKAEEEIITALLKANKAELFWDIDPYLKADALHDANHFIKRHLQRWSSFERQMYFSKDTSYTDFSSIEIVGIPKNISQAKYIGNLLKMVCAENDDKPIAVVLADEALLLPVLHSLPSEVKDINVTMGYPLVNTSAACLVEIFITFLLKKTNNSWSTIDVLPLLNNTLFKIYIGQDHSNIVAKMERRIQEGGVKRISLAFWDELLSDGRKAFAALLKQQTPLTSTTLDILHDMLLSIRPTFIDRGDRMEIAATDILISIVIELKEKETKHVALRLLKDGQYLIQELIAAKKIDLRGDAFKGVQIMGMLETRVLDFESVIIASVNEGILPAGKVQNSFIPFDVKSVFGLPTYKDKDAVYTYHFYRLLQRAQQLFITYNTEPDVLEGGEMSRLIPQLLTDETLNASITHTIATPDIVIDRPIKYEVEKTPKVLKILKERAKNGFSPTSLSRYIQNPYEFYKRYVLGIEEIQGKSETIAPNIFGTIIHDSLEHLYTPFIGQTLKKDDIILMRGRVNDVVKVQFEKTYSMSSIEKGQNLIVYNVVLKYIMGVLDFEYEQLKLHDIKILALEKDVKVLLDVPNVHGPVYLKGKLDRVDEIDGNLRILDYKTGLVKPSDIQISDYAELVETDKKSKAFQLSCYALMFRDDDMKTTLKAGILPVKNMQNGVIYFTLKGKGSIKNGLIDDDVLKKFKEVLVGLVATILDKDVPFKERET